RPAVAGRVGRQVLVVAAVGRVKRVRVQPVELVELVEGPPDTLTRDPRVVGQRPADAPVAIPGPGAGRVGDVCHGTTAVLGPALGCHVDAVRYARSLALPAVGAVHVGRYRLQ